MHIPVRRVSVATTDFSGQRSTLIRRRALGLAVPALLAARPARSQRFAPRIGVLARLGSPEGESWRRGAMLGADMLGRRGRAPMLRIVDSGADGTEAGRATQVLIDDGADLIIAAADDQATLGICQVSEARGVPAIIVQADLPRITDQGLRTVLRLVPTASQRAGRALGLLRDLHAAVGRAPPQRIALVASIDPAADSMEAAVAAVLPTSDLPVTHFISLRPGRETLGDAVASLSESDPQIVLLALDGGLMAPFIEALEAGRWRPMGLVSIGLSVPWKPGTLKRLGRLGEHHIAILPWVDARSPLLAEARLSFERRWPDRVFVSEQHRTGQMLDAMLLAAEAWERSPAARGPALAGALRATRLARKVMLGPPISFDQRGQNNTAPSVIVQVREGRPVAVLPQPVAEAPPLWPNPDWSKG